MPAPKKPLTRSAFITFRLTPPEVRVLAEAAAKSKLGVRAFIRTKLGLEP